MKDLRVWDSAAFVDSLNDFEVKAPVQCGGLSWG